MVSWIYRCRFGFLIRYIKIGKERLIKVRRRIACSLTIEQCLEDSIINKSYEPLFKSIVKFFGTILFFRTQINSSRKYLRIVVTSLNSLLIIVKYFSNFSLLSFKYLDYND